MTGAVYVYGVFDQFVVNGTRPVEIFEGANFLQILAIVVAFPAIAVFMPTLLLEKFVALRSPPKTRAALTVAPSFFITIGWLATGGLGRELSTMMLPATLFAAAATYWFLRFEYSKMWYDDDDLPDGLALANDDWKVGLIAVAALVAAAAFKALMRMNS